MSGFDNRQANNQGWDSAMDIINVLSFIVGLENMKLNITANDLDRISADIVDRLNKHLVKQDERLDRIEKMLAEKN